jgi:hypothetical protein
MMGDGGGFKCLPAPPGPLTVSRFLLPFISRSAPSSRLHDVSLANCFPLRSSAASFAAIGIRWIVGADGVRRVFRESVSGSSCNRAAPSPWCTASSARPHTNPSLPREQSKPRRLFAHHHRLRSGNQSNRGSVQRCDSVRSNSLLAAEPDRPRRPRPHPGLAATSLAGSRRLNFCDRLHPIPSIFLAPESTWR